MNQQEVLDVLKLGYNVFLTGPAGSGKTFLLSEYVDFLKSHGVRVGITASTGIAATHLNGTTIHSWSGIGVKDKLTEKDLRDLLKRKYLKKRLKKTKVLIIDEVSMLHARQLDLVNQVLQTFKSNYFQPFGGIQVVLSGDFFQLPPVSKSGDPPPKFVYQSRVWKNNFKICYLTSQWRQLDNDYLKVLNDIRNNNVGKETVKLLKKRYQAEVKTVTDPVRLYTHNIDVNQKNNRELSKLSGKKHQFSMEHSGVEPLVKSLKKNCLALERLFVKRGAPVIFIKNNFKKGYVNGTLGKIVDFHEEEPIVETTTGEQVRVEPAQWKIEEDKEIKAEIFQMPLRLAWAITVHKSQGMSLDAAEINLSKCFEPGMGYVALSRVCSLSGVCLTGLNRMAFKINEEILNIDQQLKLESNWLFKNIKKMPCKEKHRKQNKFLKSIGVELENNQSSSNKSYSVQKIRKNYPRAYKKWTPKEEQHLIRLYKAENTFWQIANFLQRQPGAIRSRIKKIKDQNQI